MSVAIARDLNKRLCSVNSIFSQFSYFQKNNFENNTNNGNVGNEPEIDNFFAKRDASANILLPRLAYNAFPPSI